MRRGQRSRRSVSHTGSQQGRQQTQHTRGSTNRRGSSESQPQVINLRRSARLNRDSSLSSSLSSRAIEAESIRESLRISSRQTHTSRRNLTHREEQRQRTPNISPNTSPTETDIMHQSTNIDGHVVNSDDRAYTLELAYPLPSRVQINSTMSPPIAVRLRIRNPNTGVEISGQDELSYLFLSVSLCRENGEGLLMQSHEMQGTSASLEPLNEREHLPRVPEVNGTRANIPLDEEVGSFAHFSNFMIVRPGNYRLKFMLYRMEQPGSLSPGSRGSNRGGQRWLATFMPLDVVVAQENGVSPRYGE